MLTCLLSRLCQRNEFLYFVLLLLFQFILKIKKRINALVIIIALELFYFFERFCAKKTILQGRLTNALEVSSHAANFI